jgi:hypothetical protein
LGLHDTRGARNRAEIVDREGSLLVHLDVLFEELFLLLVVVKRAALAPKFRRHLFSILHFEFNKI